MDKAKDYALDSSSEGLIVFDDGGNVVYENAAALSVVDKGIPREYVKKAEDGRTVYKSGSGVYSVVASSIKHGEDFLGKSIEIHDITEYHDYQENLKAAVKEATERLDIIRRKIQASFASLVEVRSLETGDHIKRVSNYTEMLAENLKKRGLYKDILTDEYINMLVQAAPLHDIGKISVPDHILLKPGKLTEDEFEEMKKHSRSGAEVIRNIMGGLETEDYVDLAEQIALYHHERWDGTGYPGKLKGNEIPLSARIVAIADCYDAMASKRCYKDAFSVTKTVDIIKSESGTHFDPDIVEAFLDSF